MFKTADWSSDEDNETFNVLRLDNSTDTPNLEINGKGSKQKQKKRSLQISTSKFMLPSVNGHKKNAVSKYIIPNLSRHMDACFNSPSLTKPLMDNSAVEVDENINKKSSKRKKAKKRKLGNGTTDSYQNITDTIKNSSKTDKTLVSNLSKDFENPPKSGIGSILTKGIKFSSESEFMKFMTQKTKKHKRASKKKKLKSQYEEKAIDQKAPLPEVPPLPPPRKKRKAPIPPSLSNEGNKIHKASTLSRTNPFHPSNLSISNNDEAFNTNPYHPKNDETNGILATNKRANELDKIFKDNTKKEGSKQSDNDMAFETNDTIIKGEESDAKRKLKSARFRFINEKLYTQSGVESLKMFQSDDEGIQAFRIYHEGFAEQAMKWPTNPLDLIISSIMKKKSDSLVIADFGCGEARLARTLSASCKKIHSFDLVALNDEITACNFSKTPLDSESVDIAVFCLSLMGTNIRDYLKEANRVLKLGGILKIAEVESRFHGEMDIDSFIAFVEKCGFNMKWKDLKKKYFYLMDFKKTSVYRKKKIPDVSLKPCLYKKR